MTVTTTPPSVVSVPTAASRSQVQFLKYILFTVCASLYLVPLVRVFLVGTDEGTLDYGAVRVFHGQVFARDFFEVIGPGTFYWLAIFFKLFGVSFLATRICLFLTSLGTAVLMYFLSRRVCRTYQVLPCILLASTIFSGLWPATSHHIDSTFFALLAVACITVWLDRPKPLLLFLAGALAGLTTAFLQPKGMLLFCAFVAWLWILHRRRLTSLVTVGFVTGGYVSVVGLILLYFWSKGALGSLIFVNLIWPSQHYGSVNSVAYAHGLISGYWDHFVIHENGLRWTYGVAALVIVPLLFVAALPVILVVLGARSRWRIARPEILLLWLCGGAIWLSELHRMDMPRLVFGSPLLIILGIYLLAEYRGRVAKLSLQVLAITSVSLAVFNLLCVLLAGHTVKTRVGSVEMFQTAPVLTYLIEHVAPGEEIFVYPYAPRYYFLSSKTNPTPYSIMVYNYNTPSQFQEVVRILEQHQVKYVLWDSNFSQATTDVFPGAAVLPPGGLIVEPYLESHYKQVDVAGGVRIMERQSDANANSQWDVPKPRQGAQYSGVASNVR